MLQSLEEYISDWHWSGVLKAFWPDGRASQFRYAVGMILCLISMSMAILAIKYLLNYSMSSEDMVAFIIVFSMSLLACIKIVLSVWAMVMLSIKRLHDINESGIWTFMLLVPPLGILLIIFLLVVPGYSFRNQYGLPIG